MQNPLDTAALASRIPGGQKMLRYSAVSVISVFVSQVVLFLAQFRWSPRTSAIIAVSVSAVPSYYLNRSWAWGKSGRSHLMKEVMPFWGLAFLGLVFSTWAAGFAATHAHLITDSSLGTKLVVNASNIAAFGVLWVAKFVILNKVLFAGRTEELPPALDGRTGVPT